MTARFYFARWAAFLKTAVAALFTCNKRGTFEVIISHFYNFRLTAIADAAEYSLDIKALLEIRSAEQLPLDFSVYVIFLHWLDCGNLLGS